MFLPAQPYTRRPGEDGPGQAEGAGERGACIWHGWAPVGERGAPSLARLGPRTQAYENTRWAGEGPTAPVDTLVQVGVVTVGFPTSLFF